MLQVLHMFRTVQCPDNDPITHSDEDPTSQENSTPLEYVNGHEF